MRYLQNMKRNKKFAYKQLAMFWDLLQTYTEYLTDADALGR